MALIHEALADIMKAVPNITKDRQNQQQGFKYRGIDDVYAAVHPLFVEHGVFSVPCVESERSEDRVSGKGNALIYRVLKIRYDFFARDGSSISATVIGEGMDSGDKASNKAMAVAHKYAILQILSIPTEENLDPDAEAHDVKPKTGNPPPARPSFPPPASHSAPPAAGMAGVVALVNEVVPAADKPQWMGRARACKTPEEFAALTTELKARYAGKVA